MEKKSSTHLPGDNQKPIDPKTIESYNQLGKSLGVLASSFVGNAGKFSRGVEDLSESISLLKKGIKESEEAFSVSAKNLSLDMEKSVKKFSGTFFDVASKSVYQVFNKSISEMTGLGLRFYDALEKSITSGATNFSKKYDSVISDIEKDENISSDIIKNIVSDYNKLMESFKKGEIIDLSSAKKSIDALEKYIKTKHLDRLIPQKPITLEDETGGKSTITPPPIIDKANITKEGLDILNDIKDEAKKIYDDILSKSNDIAINIATTTAQTAASVMSALENAGKESFQYDLEMAKKNLSDLKSYIGSQQFKLLDPDVQKKVFDDITKNVELFTKQLNIAQVASLKLSKTWSDLSSDMEESMKPFEKIDSALGKIPVIGDSLKKIFNFEGIKKSFEMNVRNSLLDGNEKADLFKNALKSVGDTFKGSMSQLKNPVTWITGGFTILFALISKVFNLFGKLFGEQERLAKETGLLRGDTEKLLNMSVDVASQYAEYGVTIESASDAIIAFKKELGNAQLINKQLVGDTALLASQYKISEESSAKLFRTLRMTSTASSTTRQHFMGVTREISKITGLGMNEIVDEMANNSGVFYKNFKGSKEELLKVTVQAKMLGLSLQDIAGMSDSLLDWESSIENEMTASVMLGRQLDLNAARVAAFSGDMSKLTDEVVRQAGTFDEFMSLDVIRRNQMAKAFGLTAEKMGEMLNKQDLLRKSGLLEQYKNISAEIDKLNAKSGLSILDEQKQLLYTTALKASWNKIEMVLVKIALGLMPIVQKAVEFISKIVTNIAKWFGVSVDDLADFSKTSDKTMSKAEAAAKKFSKRFDDIAKSLEPFWNGFVIMMKPLELIFDILKSIFSMNWTKWLAGGIIGLRVLRFALKKISDVIWTPKPKLPNADAVDAKNVGKSTKRGPLIGKGFVDSTKNLFEGMREIIKGVFKSISEILKGLTDVIKTTLDSITGIISKAFDSVGKIFESLAKNASKMFRSVATILNEFIESLGSILNNALKTVTSVLNTLIKSIGSILNTAVDVVGKLLGKILDVVLNIGDKLVNFIVKTLTKVSDSLPTILGNIGKAISAFLTNISVGLEEFGAVLMTGVGAVALAALLISILAIGAAIRIAAPGIEAFGKMLQDLAIALKEFVPIIMIISDTIVNITKIIGKTIVEIVKSVFDGVTKLANINASQLLAVSSAILTLGGALATLGAGTLINALTNFAASLFGGGSKSIFENLMMLGNNSDKIAAASESVKTLTYELNGLASVNYDKLKQVGDIKLPEIPVVSSMNYYNELERMSKLADPLSTLASSIKLLTYELKGLATVDFNKINSVADSIDRINTAKTNLTPVPVNINPVDITSRANGIKNKDANKPNDVVTQQSNVINSRDDRVPALLSELIQLMKSGAIAVNMDGKKVSSMIHSYENHTGVGGNGTKQGTR
jgi:hypothetical protein